MKRWQIVTASLVAPLALVLAPVVALAQGGPSAATEARPQLKGALAIVAPRVVALGKEMSLGVFERHNQEPVGGVGVWAVTRDKAEALRKDAQVLKEKLGAGVEDKDYEALLGPRGTFLGRTGGNGKLTCTFKTAGDYVLIAAKARYWPDFAGLRVKEIPRALGINAPRRATVGESVTIGVFHRGTQEPVNNAGVWAVTRETAPALKEKVAAIREANQGALQNADWEATVKAAGAIFLGTTHGNGELKYTFNKAGGYLLVAIEKGYIPGYGVIVIAPVEAAANGNQTRVNQAR